MALKLKITKPTGHSEEYHAPMNLGISKNSTLDEEGNKVNTFRVRTSFASFKDEVARDAGAPSSGGLDVQQEISQLQFNQVLALLKTFEKAKEEGAPLEAAEDII